MRADSKIEEYRRKADACEASAASSKRPDMKLKWLDLARQWREMADLLERSRTKADVNQGQGVLVVQLSQARGIKGWQ
jgi:hypothetical protein